MGFQYVAAIRRGHTAVARRRVVQQSGKQKIAAGAVE